MSCYLNTKKNLKTFYVKIFVFPILSVVLDNFDKYLTFSSYIDKRK